MKTIRQIAESAKRKRIGTVLWAVHGLDVWGNKRDGYNVNDVYPSRGVILLPEDYTNRELVSALKAAGFIDRNIRHSSVNIDDQEDVIYIEDRNGKPAYELRKK